jgi:hypothetical protein
MPDTEHHAPHPKQAHEREQAHDPSGPDAGVLTLAHRRWFGLGLCLLSMLVGALTFSLGFPQAGPARSAQVIGHIFLGPFAEPAWFPWFRPVAPVILPWLSVLLLLSHPLRPRPLTVLTTCAGGALWWLMGWYAIATVS